MGTQDDDLVDEMGNYVASGWKRDLIHMVGCCWAAQVGPLETEVWQVAIEKFISVMVQWKKEWTEVKELTLLKYMPYVAKLFHEVTGKDLWGLGKFTGWIGLGGYYHWRVVQQGLIHLAPCLQNEPRPMMPKARPSGRPPPLRLAPTSTPATGALAGPPGGAQPTPQGGGQRPASNQGGRQRPASTQGGRQGSTPSQGEGSSASNQGGVRLLPAKAEGPQLQVRAGGHQLPAKVPHPPPWEVPLTSPQVARELATEPAGIS